MKIKSVVAVGAMGIGLGLASLVGGTGVASADCSSATIPNPGTPPPDEIDNPDYTPPLTPARVACVTNANISTFLKSTDPFNNFKILVNGTTDAPELGLKNQPSTFVKSIVGPGGFLDGPREPDDAPDPAP